MIDWLPETKEKPAAGEMRSDEFSDLKLGLYTVVLWSAWGRGE